MTKSKATYLMHTDNDCTIAKIARVSFDACDAVRSVKDDFALLAYLLIEGHTSPFRHPSVRFKLDVPLDVFAQLSTHKVGIAMQDVSYNSKSYRYVSPQDYDAVELREKAADKKQGSGAAIDTLYLRGIVNEAVAMSHGVYRSLVDNDVAGECARRILPVCTMTTVIATGTLYAWMNFVALRCAPDTQKETRLLAEQVQNVLRVHYPATMFMWEKFLTAQAHMRAELRSQKIDMVKSASEYFGGFSDDGLRHDANQLGELLEANKKLSNIALTGAK